MPIEAFLLVGRALPLKDHAYAARKILPPCDRLKMFWVHAGSIAAKVVNIKSSCNRPDPSLIGEAMSHSPIHSSIPSACFGLLPNPTTGIASFGGD